MSGTNFSEEISSSLRIGVPRASALIAFAFTDPEFNNGAYRYNAEFKVGGSQTCTDWDFILRQEGAAWKVADILRGRCN
ncbi:MAG: hypothetical protein LDLANPLL_00638 [Turneriella sp.]|nr:hypothetical protein [Turneriella sp.]